MFPNLRHGSSTFHQTSAETKSPDCTTDQSFGHDTAWVAPVHCACSRTLRRFPSLSGSCTLRVAPVHCPAFPAWVAPAHYAAFPAVTFHDRIGQGSSNLFQTRKLWLRKASCVTPEVILRRNKFSFPNFTPPQICQDSEDPRFSLE